MHTALGTIKRPNEWTADREKLKLHFFYASSSIFLCATIEKFEFIYSLNCLSNYSYVWLKQLPTHMKQVFQQLKYRYLSLEAMKK